MEVVLREAVEDLPIAGIVLFPLGVLVAEARMVEPTVPVFTGTVRIKVLDGEGRHVSKSNPNHFA